MNCCICKKKINGRGNNPAPLKTRGRCCDECNELVIQARIIEIMNKYENEKRD